MKKEIMIIGTGDQARVASEIFSAGNRTVKGFVVPEENESPGCIDALPVFSWDKAAELRNRVLFHVGIGLNSKRKEISEKALGAGFELVSAVHPEAVLGTGTEIGMGSCVSAKAVLVLNVTLGRGCIVNTSASLDHDCVLGDWSHVGPGAVLAGNVTVGAGSFVGVGAVVLQEVSIGEGAVAGAGSVVLEDLPPHVTAVGVPARVVKGG